MAVHLRIRRGLESQLPTLLEGEFGYTTDTKKLYIGTASGNLFILNDSEVTSTPTAGKVLRLNDEGKLPADITGGAETATTAVHAATAGSATTAATAGGAATGQFGIADPTMPRMTLYIPGETSSDMYINNAGEFTLADTNDSNSYRNLNVGNINTVGGQIKFPSAQNASTDPNTLDDYEEGIFTPYVSGTTTEGNGTYTLQIGNYVKIGSVICFTARISWTGHTGTGSLRMMGLPFVPNNEYACSVSVSTLTYTGQLCLKTMAGIAGIYIYQIGSGTIAEVAMDTSVSNFCLSGLYRVN